MVAFLVFDILIEEINKQTKQLMAFTTRDANTLPELAEDDVTDARKFKFSNISNIFRFLVEQTRHTYNQAAE